MEKHGFNVPVSKNFRSADASLDLLEGFDLPVIVKPTDGSGSRGVTAIRSEDEFLTAVGSVSERSRNDVLILEEFIERDHEHVIEGEIFVVGGKVESWGLINSVRDLGTNPLFPAGYSSSLDLPDARIVLVQDEVQRLMEIGGI